MVKSMRRGCAKHYTVVHLNIFWLMVAKQSHHHPKVNGSSPDGANESRRKKISKCMKECDANCYTVLCQLFNSVWLATAA